MSHIPSSAMPHAGPTHHDEPAAPPESPKPATSPKPEKRSPWPVAAIALGGILALGAIAVAVPLVRGSAPKPKRKGGRRKPRG